MFLRVTSCPLWFMSYATQGLISVTGTSSKCAVLRVANAACWASTIPAIIVSRSSPRPLSCAEMPLDHLLPAQQQHRMHASTWGSKWVDKRRASKSMFDGAYECACSRSYFRYLLQARL